VPTSRGLSFRAEIDFTLETQGGNGSLFADPAGMAALQQATVHGLRLQRVGHPSGLATQLMRGGAGRQEKILAAPCCWMMAATALTNQMRNLLLGHSNVSALVRQGLQKQVPCLGFSRWSTPGVLIVCRLGATPLPCPPTTLPPRLAQYNHRRWVTT